MENNTLPDDIKSEILYKAGSHTQFCDEAVREHGAYIAGATEYAQYKAKFEQAERLLDKFMARHEAGLLPDVFIYNEIKTFLDGSK